jgi:hypothetical protein
MATLPACWIAIYADLDAASFALSSAASFAACLAAYSAVFLAAYRIATCEANFAAS